MRKLLAILSFVFMPVFIFSQATDLFISEYIEGSGYNKALEIFNGTGAPVDLSQYQVWRISNGGNWPEATINLSGTLNDGDVFVIANPSADQAVLDVADTTSSNASWNGDDAVGLAKDDGNGNFVLIDAIGEDGADPGTGWDVAGVTNATADHTLIRKEDVTSPTTDWAASAGTNSEDSQWIVQGQDYFNDLGTHTFNPANNTTVQFATASGTADEGAGTYDLVVTIANPDANNATTADVVLISGDPADLGNYTTQTVTFPAGSSADQIVTITITDDSEVEGDEDFTFQLQNVSGGNGAMAGSPSQHVLTITDNDFADVPDIVINEIMQNPSAVDDSKGEWFELYNNDTETVDINGWIIKDDGVDYHVIDNGGPLTIAPGEYLVLGNNDTTTVNGGVPVDYMYHNFILSNGDDEVVLVYSDGVTEVDRVNYDGGPNFPDPSGASMELKNPNYDNNEGANWDTATTAYGDGDKGTPGAQNSNFVSALEDGPALHVESFKILQNYPNPFNPETKLLVHLSSNVRQLKIDIFNAAGQHVKSIYQGALSAGQHTFSWNGRDNSGKNSPSGMYFAIMKSSNAQHSIKMILLR
ncbi:lamin tail domain-containing protein [Calditrichota bacterium GD2]